MKKKQKEQHPNAIKNKVKFVKAEAKRQSSIDLKLYLS